VYGMIGVYERGVRGEGCMGGLRGHLHAACAADARVRHVAVTADLVGRVHHHHAPPIRRVIQIKHSTEIKQRLTFKVNANADALKRRRRFDVDLVFVLNTTPARTRPTICGISRGWPWSCPRRAAPGRSGAS